MFKPSSACLLSVLLVSLHLSLALPAPSSDFLKTVLIPEQAAPGQPTSHSAELHGHSTSQHSADQQPLHGNLALPAPPTASGSGHFRNYVLSPPKPGQPTGHSAELHGHSTSQHSADQQQHHGLHPTQQEPRGPDHGQHLSGRPSRPRRVRTRE